MAKVNMIAMLRAGRVEEWNAWKLQNPGESFIINGNDLDNLCLNGVDFSGVEFNKVDFSGSKLIGAVFDSANVHDSDFSGANLSGANFVKAYVTSCCLFETDLSTANFAGASLEGSHSSTVQMFRKVLNIDAARFLPPEAHTALILDAIASLKAKP